MNEIIFKVENITPVFIAGADQRYIDNEGLRAPTLKGLLRWWFRALMGGIVSEKALRRFEEEIFGSTDKKSPVRILSFCDNQPSMINIPGDLQYLWFSMKMQRKNKELYCYPPKTEFEIILCSENEDFLKLVTGCLWLLIYLGGVGSRNRRGAGSLKVKKVKPSITYDFVFEKNNVIDAKSFMEKNLKKIFDDFKKCVNEKYDIPQRSPYFPILSKSSAKVTLGPQYNDWKEALGEIEKKYKNFRRKKLKGKKWKYRGLLGLPIKGLPIKHKRNYNWYKKKRQPSPFHIGVMDLNKGYTTRVVKFYTSIHPRINEKVFKNKGISELKRVLDDLNRSLLDGIEVEIPG
ncbi:MAG: type III-B CRISPR module RAMP protein Cmr1 [Methanobacteriales archaeon]